jgi:hypothetical protein
MVLNINSDGFCCWGSYCKIMSGALALFLGSEVDACSECTVDASKAATESPHLVVGIGKKNPLIYWKPYKPPEVGEN